MEIYISLIIITLYISYYIINYGIPKSLSITYYKCGLTLSLAIIICSGLIFPKMMEITEYQFLPFITLASILFVAFAPNYQDEDIIDYVHTSAAILALISSQILVYLVNPLILLYWIPYLLVESIFKFNNFKFWAEVVMLLTIYSILL